MVVKIGKDWTVESFGTQEHERSHKKQGYLYDSLSLSIVENTAHMYRWRSFPCHMRCWYFFLVGFEKQ